MIAMPSGTAAEERETVIQWDDADRTVIIWTARPADVRKLLKRGVNPVEESLRPDGTVHGYTFRIPLSEFRWGLKGRQKGRFLPSGPHGEAISSTERQRNDLEGG